LINFFAVAHNASVGRQRFNMLQMMAEPCGPNPNKDA
jgi:hypothetical protein